MEKFAARILEPSSSQRRALSISWKDDDVIYKKSEGRCVAGPSMPAKTYITCGSIPNKLKLPGANFSISCGPPDTSFLESSLNTSTNTIGYLTYLLMNKLISHFFWKKNNDPAS